MMLKDPVLGTVLSCRSSHCDFLSLCLSNVYSVYHAKQSHKSQRIKTLNSSGPPPSLSLFLLLFLLLFSTTLSVSLSFVDLLANLDQALG